MEKIEIKIKTLPHFDKKLSLPTYATIGSAGADIRACLENPSLCIKPGQRVLIPTGLSFEIPPNYEIQVRPRSGLSFKTGLMVVNSPGTIDSDYRGELKIILGNLGNEDEIINHGDRVAQIVLQPTYRAEYIFASNLEQTDRGQFGFGHTGLQ